MKKNRALTSMVCKKRTRSHSSSRKSLCNFQCNLVISSHEHKLSSLTFSKIWWLLLRLLKAQWLEVSWLYWRQDTDLLWIVSRNIYVLLSNVWGNISTDLVIPFQFLWTFIAPCAVHKRFSQPMSENTMLIRAMKDVIVRDPATCDKIQNICCKGARSIVVNLKNSYLNSSRREGVWEGIWNQLRKRETFKAKDTKMTCYPGVKRFLAALSPEKWW